VSRLALFIPELECGGAQRVMLLLAREFVARGHGVDLILAQARGSLMEEIPPAVQVVDLRAKAGWFGAFGLGLSSTVRLSRYLHAQRPYAMLSTLTGANLVAVAARRLSGVTTRLVLREAVSLKNRKGGVWQRLMASMYLHADAVVTLSPALEREMMEALSIPRRRLHCIPNPVDVAKLWSLAEAPLDDLRFESAEYPFIIAVGRLIEQKDHATLIRAFARVAAGTNLHLVILGEGPLRHRLEQLVRQLGLGERVHMPGHDPNPWRWMRRARLFVLSSRWEGHPNALLEAMGLQLPVVVTAYDEHAKELVRDHGCAVPVANADQLADAIMREASQSVRRIAKNLSSVTSVSSSYLEVLLPGVAARG